MIRSMVWAAGIAAFTFVLGVGVASAAHPSTVVYVDDDCTPPADGTITDPFCTIQEGVDHALAGQKVIVMAGVYNESVSVTKLLTVTGAQVNVDGRTRSAPAASESVVNGSFTLGADGIALNGFTIEDNAAGPGITTSASFSGYKITHNIIQNHVFGIYLNSNSTVRSTVSRNLFRDNDRVGAASGNGIYSDLGLHKTTIERNKFKDHANTSITLAGTQTKLTISRNEAENERTMVNMFTTDGAEISRNTGGTFAPGGSAIFLGGGNDDVMIERNMLDGADFSGIRVRNLGLGVNSNLEISRNKITDMGDFGIAVGTAHNDPLGTPDVGPAMTGGLMERNNVTGNGFAYGADGIFFGPGNTGNTLNRNIVKSNDHHDVHDDTIGGGTAGTGNTWMKTFCTTSSPAGLCS